MRIRSFTVLSCYAAIAAASRGQVLTTLRVADGLSLPLFAIAAPGDHDRLFIVEQRGSGGIADQAQIRILNLRTGLMNPEPFLTIAPVATDGSKGILGLAFDPAYTTTGRFYVDYIDDATTITVARYRVSEDPGLADPGSAEILLTQPNPGGDHFGGWIGFGPDGFLYISIGDGGPWYDPSGHGQDLTTLFGKILRIDVSGEGYTIPPTNPFAGSADFRQEIWAYGLRNPWRTSFDRETGDLWIADVGQDLWEEIDVQARPGSPPYAAANYGWRCYEASAVQNTTTGPGGAPCSSVPDLVFPLYAYDHGQGCSITGGYVYRGGAMPWLRGAYFFADYCSGRVWSIRDAGGQAQDLREWTAELARPGQTIDAIVSFGEDADGELYVCDQNEGEIYKIVPRCPANCDGSAAPPVLNVNDFVCFTNAFAAGDPYANCDGSTIPPVLNVNDFICFQNRAAQGCP